MNISKTITCKYSMLCIMLAIIVAVLFNSINIRTGNGCKKPESSVTFMLCSDNTEDKHRS